MNEIVDWGDWIHREKVEVLPHDTSTSLYERVIDCELKGLDFMLDDIIANTYEKFDHHDIGNYNKMADFKKLCEFNPSELSNFGEFFNVMRALSHTGYMNAHMNGIKFKLIIDETTHSIS